MTEPIVSAFKPYKASPNPNAVKLAISVCSNRPLYVRPPLGFAMMIHHLTAFQVPFAIIARVQASILPQSRQDCQDEALADECTHQLWWDDDIEPPPDAPLRMLQAMHMNPEIDILAANYVRKQDVLQYTAEDLNGQMMTSNNRVGVEEALRVGMGLMMVKLDKLRSIPAPHYEVRWHPKHNKYMGEDRYFIEKCRANGMRVFVDHKLSAETQHWGEIPYSPRLFEPREYGKIPAMTPMERGVE